MLVRLVLVLRAGVEAAPTEAEGEVAMAEAEEDLEGTDLK
jgi:hypothetical protein